MKIGIDIDSTLNLLSEEWSAWIMEKYDPSFSLEKWTDWNINRLCAAGNKVYDYLSIPGVFRNCGVRDGARQKVWQLHDDGHDLLIVSSCDPASSWEEKFDWVREHFPFIPKKNLIACSRKGLLKLDVMIDDGPHNFDGFDGRAILYDQPWNRQYVGERIYHWEKLSL